MVRCISGNVPGPGLLKGVLTPGIIIHDKIVQKKTYLEFPAVGASNTLYIASEENASYRWDDELLKYYCVGRDYTEIKEINGGTAKNE